MDQSQAADVSHMNVTPESEIKTPEELTALLAHLQAKWQDGTDKMSIEEKKKHRDMLMNVLQMVGIMEDSDDLKKSVCDSGDDGMVLQMRCQSGFVNFVFSPSSEEIQAAFAARNQKNVYDALVQANVKHVSIEENFNFLKSGPKSPNYLLKEKEVYVRFESVEQASHVLRIGEYLHVKINANQKAPFQFFAPKHSTTTRATYRTIGNLILRLKEVDQQLKALGAIPGRGGVPELSEMLVQINEFDGFVARANAAHGYDKATLHSFLCTRTRVDKRKRQAALDPLVDERIDILLKLTKYDPDDVPFTFEREFK